MTRHLKANMRRRLRNLAVLELINIPFQAFIWFGTVGFPATVANVVGFAIVALLLVEGASYWEFKRGQLDISGSSLPRFLIIARAANVYVLTAGLLITGWAVVVEPGTGSLPGLGFAVFAVLEHVNYFHLQLMHDNASDLRYLFRHGFRRAHLGRDLDLRRERTPRLPR